MMYTQLCVWPGTVLGESKPKELEDFFLKQFGTRVQYKCEMVTNPDRDSQGNPIPQTGGRNDLFFYVHKDDVKKFSIQRLSFGIRWWEDVIKYNDNSHLYPREFIRNNPPMW